MSNDESDVWSGSLEDLDNLSLAELGDLLLEDDDFNDLDWEEFEDFYADGDYVAEDDDTET
eukprot:CAMPEP_0185623698 /NCGR_PEP_ID=MMETSP0436-20130131/60057_1 /TAXON_ID=626734 ORGANISM="Favella taraikaensis, Strain Fe Narragansett Bay" /NCGR_SAMPLE_ID=MMETSP0436 /ASSEMBLY_ACC=CAM_ASM_000390 /LENGTH=60 /DNA_ID=CAMNT_0028265847 /DNA_START=1990 /DNA_END=2172 /DNA_ORIENTATION=+